MEPPTIEWFDLSTEYGRTRASLEAEMIAARRWRYHHDIPALIEGGDLYSAYVRRIEALLAMCDDALAALEIDIRNASAVDLACAEGFVAAHYVRRGVPAIDCFELAMVNIERFRLVAAWHQLGRTPGPAGTDIRLGRLDLDNVAWSQPIGRTYDLVFALGIAYHVENLALFCRNLFEITGEVCLVESDTPAFPEAPRFRGHGVVYLHRDRVTVDEGEVRQLTEMRPDRKALMQLLLSAGFARVAVVPPNENARDRHYDSGEKSLLVCIKT